MPSYQGGDAQRDLCSGLILRSPTLIITSFPLLTEEWPLTLSVKQILLIAHLCLLFVLLFFPCQWVSTCSSCLLFPKPPQQNFIWTEREGQMGCGRRGAGARGLFCQDTCAEYHSTREKVELKNAALLLSQSPVCLHLGNGLSIWGVP